MDPAVPRRSQGLLAFFSFFFAMGAAALAVSAVLRWRTRSDVTSHWPMAAATVRHCAVHRDYPFRRSGGGISVWMACDVAYDVAGRSIETRVTSISKHAGRDGKLFTLRAGHFVVEHPVTILEGWSRRHPRGSAIDVRYDPANPSQATFVGADAVLDDDPVPGTLAGVALFGLLALSAGIGASLLRRNQVAIQMHAP
jgi:Protein of unknown function (DUF3592)